MNEFPVFRPIRRVLTQPLQLYNSVNEFGSLMPVGSIIKCVGIHLCEYAQRVIDVIPEDGETYEGSISLVGDEIDWFSETIP